MMFVAEGSIRLAGMTFAREGKPRARVLDGEGRTQKSRLRIASVGTVARPPPVISVSRRPS